MSRNQFLKLTFSIFAFVGLVAFALHKTKSPERVPSSLHSLPHIQAPKVMFPNARTNYEKLIQNTKPQKPMYGKTKGALEVELELMEDCAPETPFRLKAKISATKDIDVLEYKWVTQGNTETLAGSKGSAVYNIGPDAPQEVEVSLIKSDDNFPARVFFVVSYEENGKRYGQSAYYSSQHQSKANLAQQKLSNPNVPKIPADLKVIY